MSMSITKKEEIEIESIISKLLEGRFLEPNTEISLEEEQVVMLIDKVKPIFMEQQMLLELEPPINICGDVHGQYYDLLRIFEQGGIPPQSNYLFLGDYVDRGSNSIEILCLLFALKIRYPNQVYLLRGNHESISMNQLYGFCDEIQRRFNPALYYNFLDVFSVMPIAALVGSRILCMHGGLSPDIKSLDDIANIPRPYEIPDEGLICDLLWADPKRNQNQKWEPNERGVSYTFSEEVVEDFLKKFDLDLICRAHQVQDEGYSFFANGGLITLFSAPNYVGEMDNGGAFLTVNEELECTVKLIHPNNPIGLYALNKIFFEEEMEEEEDEDEEDEMEGGTGKQWYYAYDLDYGEDSI